MNHPDSGAYLLTLDNDTLARIAERGCERWAFYYEPEFNLCICAPCRASVKLFRRRKADDGAASHLAGAP